MAVGRSVPAAASRQRELGDCNQGEEPRLALSDTTAQNYELRDPDVRLMLQVRDDNAAAFEELVVRYQGRLITVLEQLVHKRDVAEDLAQEVFLRVFRARKTYQPGAKFSTWLFTIANNVASNALRSLARRREVQRRSAPRTAIPGARRWSRWRWPPAA